MSAVQAIRCETFWLPKHGHTAEEYEDACHADPSRGRFAIADGASESSFAGQWARLLVERFVQSAELQPAPWSKWLPAVQELWQAEMDGRELPWFAETKAQQGAFATFLGLVVESFTTLCGTRRRWRAVAVGDSCFFQLRAGRLRRAFPLQRAGDFGNTPWLLGSRDQTDALVEKGKYSRGKWCAGDRFWLMTDALAQWFLQEVAASRKPWETLEPLLTDLQPQERFQAWIEEQRASGVLRNDDVTLQVVDL